MTLDQPLTSLSAAQANDVTIVYPLTGKPDDYITAVGLLPKQLFADATGIVDDADPNPAGDPTVSYRSLRLVALRVDPCFAHLGPITNDAECEAQLRLVFQPLTGDEHRASTARRA